MKRDDELIQNNLKAARENEVVYEKLNRSKLVSGHRHFVHIYV